MEKVEFAKVFAEAQAAAEAAFVAAKPVPMAVQEAKGLSDGFDFNRPTRSSLMACVVLLGSMSTLMVAQGLQK